MMEACGEASTARVSPGAASPNWKACASITMVSPAAIGRGDDAEELDLLLRRGRGAQPVAGLEIGDRLAGDRERGADHAGDRHDEEHARSSRRRRSCSSTTDEMMIVSIVMPETGIARGGGDGVGGDRGEEEREDQRQHQADQEDGSGVGAERAEEDRRRRSRRRRRRPGWS